MTIRFYIFAKSLMFRHIPVPFFYNFNYMAAALFNRYIWLVDTIYSAGNISRDEINRRWRTSQYNEDHEAEIPERTFHRHKDAIQSMFDIEIRYNRSNETYYIANLDDAMNGEIRKWLVNTFAVNNLIQEGHQLKKRILFEEIPSGQRFLTPIIEAMRDEWVVKMGYRGFDREEAHTFIVEPYCVKVFRQRWYLVARNVTYDEVRIYALDRIESFQTIDVHFRLPRDFDAARYFENSFGITVEPDRKPELVRVKVSPRQSNYLRTLPLHRSQEEVEREPDYSIFEYLLVPTFDFQQELRRYGADLEVLSPRWLREEVIADIHRQIANYIRQ